MSKRLEIAKNLLSKDGVIFISIDDNEQAQLKLLCDEIFEEKNLLSIHHIQVRYDNKSLNEKNEWQPIMEYIYIYAKDKINFKANQPYEEYDIEKFKFSIEELTSGQEIYLGDKKVTIFKKGEWDIKSHKEGNISLLKETWASGSVLKGNTSGKFFDLYISKRKDIDGLFCLYKVEGIGEDGLGYRYFTGAQKATSIRGKFYSGIPLERLSELENGNSKKYKSITNLYDFSADFGNIRHEGNIGFNSGKKPVKLLKMLINYHKNKNITILDFFAGSGTTGHAVAQLNKEDGGNRHYILCTNNENGICEDITYQRLKNIQEELPHKLKYLKTDFIDRFSNEDIGIKQKLMPYIKALIELEHGCEIDNIHYLFILTEEELEHYLTEDLMPKAKIFIAPYILLDQSQNALIHRKQAVVIDIPEYYFRNELVASGEL